MNRKQFLIQATAATVFSKTILTTPGFAQQKGKTLNLMKALDVKDLVSLVDTLKDEVAQLFKWMDENGWLRLSHAVSGLSFSTSDPSDQKLFQPFSPNLTSVVGCDDFAGKKLIEPGYPAFSLLYHLLASPLVKLEESNKVITDCRRYPTLEQLDTLENYIYGLQQISGSLTNPKEMIAAIFAYEYRPAAKTPHEQHADLVFARTGVTRVGTEPIAYDRINRCFTNLPTDLSKESKIAVTPARYGLFLAEKVRYDKVAQWDIMKADDDGIYDFIKPIRKISKYDPLLKGAELFFEESHRNEKLYRLYEANKGSFPKDIFDPANPPFIRESSSTTNPANFPDCSKEYDNTLVFLKVEGSSVLLGSVPQPLVRKAHQPTNPTGERLRFRIPAKSPSDIYKHSNRRYTSFKILGKDANRKDAWDLIWENTVYKDENITNYHVPRNAPMFVNIREQLDENGRLIKYLNPQTDNLYEETDKSYWTGLFEDSICDGCVSARISNKENGVTNKVGDLDILPAFSIVTAPDFFPYVDSQDINEFKELFFIGGVNDMGGARLRANPDIHLPCSSTSAFPLEERNIIEESSARTIVSVLSHSTEIKNPNLDLKNIDSLIRTNFLPDSATRIFYPGWDITYAGPENIGRKKEVRFFATYGLGSPFVEDSKLCAAANGMWAAASPDSARTFRGSLSKIPRGFIKKAIRPPTAIPLLDIEIGIHEDSPARKQAVEKSWGWDGEQGPFLKVETNVVKINYTDIGAADYVKNACDGKFDMSLLRKITIKEVKLRMNCLDRCYKKAPVIFKKFWLVGAEAVDWSLGAKAYAIPFELYSNSNSWIQAPKLKGGGAGYLFVFAKTLETKISIPKSERCEMICNEIYCFQVNENDIAYCSLSKTNGWKPIWKH